MKPQSVRRLAFAVAAAAAACTNSEAMRDELGDLRGVGAVELVGVRFDYEKWTSAEPGDVVEARASEVEWTALVAEAFTAHARERGFAVGPGGAPVEIAVIDLEPGYRAARLIKSMAGTGLVVADVQVVGRGSFLMGSEVIGGFAGGAFSTALTALGEAIADHLAKRAGR